MFMHRLLPLSADDHVLSGIPNKRIIPASLAVRHTAQTRAIDMHTNIVRGGGRAEGRNLSNTTSCNNVHTPTAVAATTTASFPTYCFTRAHTTHTHAMAVLLVAGKGQQ